MLFVRTTRMDGTRSLFSYKWNWVHILIGPSRRVHCTHTDIVGILCDRILSYCFIGVSETSRQQLFFIFQIRAVFAAAVVIQFPHFVHFICSQNIFILYIYPEKQYIFWLIFCNNIYNNIYTREYVVQYVDWPAIVVVVVVVVVYWLCLFHSFGNILHSTNTCLIFVCLLQHEWIHLNLTIDIRMRDSFCSSLSLFHFSKYHLASHALWIRNGTNVSDRLSCEWFLTWLKWEKKTNVAKTNRLKNMAKKKRILVGD